MASFIHQETAEKAVVDRLLRVFSDFLDTRLDAMWNRSGNYTGSDSGFDYDFLADVYLPTPTQMYRQTGPTTEQEQGVGEPVLFVGPIGDATPTGSKPAGSATGFDSVWQMSQDFAVTILFGRGGNKAVADPVLDRNLREEEHVRERAIYYLGTLVDIVNSRAPSAYGADDDIPEIHTIKPLGRQSAQVEFTLNSDRYISFGMSAFKFSVINFQGFPRRDYSSP